MLFTVKPTSDAFTFRQQLIMYLIFIFNSSQQMTCYDSHILAHPKSYKQANKHKEKTIEQDMHKQMQANHYVHFLTA